MTVPWLDDTDFSFPPLVTALTEPNGLLAVGGDLSNQRLRLAYKQGIFPWYEEGGPIFWWSPDPRSVLRPNSIKITRSFRKTLASNKYRVSCNMAFNEVIQGCSESRTYTASTWITPYMKKAYIRLHQAGVAHSYECWLRGKLVGGLYGISIGRIFFGESMYHHEKDASKVALAHMCRKLSQAGFPLIDCQVKSDHLDSMGAEDMDRAEFTEYLVNHTDSATDQDLWAPCLLPDW